MKQYIQNNTFRRGSNIDFNACVGLNGSNDISTYEYGYNLAVESLINVAKNEPGIVDPIIYPLVFSARHRIELFLKKTIVSLEFVNKLVKKTFNYLKYINTHDLHKLWDYTKELSLIDKRYIDLINNLETFVSDYFVIDLTGEVFRYPYSKDDTHHLDEFAWINILFFEKQYKDMSEIMITLDNLSEMISEEYKQNTFIDGISRFEIEQISRLLPHREKWIESNFDCIRSDIKNKYNLSSNALSRVIKIIEKHREFSVNIGKIIPVEEIDKSNFNFFKEIIYKYKSNNSYVETREQFMMEINSALSKSSIVALRAFDEIGFHKLYSEQYDPLVKHFSERSSLYLLSERLLDNKRIIEWIESGIMRCGQIHLLP